MLGGITIAAMEAELQRRVTQLDQPSANAALNRAIRWINRSGSYTFQLVGPLNLTPTVASVAVDTGSGYAVAPMPQDLDLGKAMFVANSPQGTFLVKSGVQDIWATYAFNIPSDQGYAVWVPYGRSLLLRPSQSGAQQIGVFYHTLSLGTDSSGMPNPGTLRAVLTGSDLTFFPLPFDDLVIDLAEASEGRIFRIAGAPDEADVKGSITLMAQAYLSVSQEVGLIDEAKEAITEKTQLGRD